MYVVLRTRLHRDSVWPGTQVGANCCGRFYVYDGGKTYNSGRRHQQEVTGDPGYDSHAHVSRVVSGRV